MILLIFVLGGITIFVIIMILISYMWKRFKSSSTTTPITQLPAEFHTPRENPNDETQKVLIDEPNQKSQGKTLSSAIPHQHGKTGFLLKKLVKEDQTALPGPLSTFILVDAKNQIHSKSPRQKTPNLNRHADVQYLDTFQFQLKLQQNGSVSDFENSSSRPAESSDNNPQNSTFQSNNLRMAFASMIRKQQEQPHQHSNHDLKMNSQNQIVDFNTNKFVRIMRQKLSQEFDNHLQVKPKQNSTANISTYYKSKNGSIASQQIGQNRKNLYHKSIDNTAAKSHSIHSSIVNDDELGFRGQYVDFYIAPLDHNRFMMPTNSNKRGYNSKHLQLKKNVRR
ncbi:UNKNOWN [Stylonychia lemnae]|uniref:Uncharacterized protein n=1 Tax=Stylonychia lemnae TaxID=5949 RepID=A0A078B0K4_STYLE|nr:UNKNOWN [Stylonychia lemnae]|eukprot:CDW86638.1 UNKNOWN [Stylonychia lemnae]